MQLRQLHLLLTYKCDRACDHCFVWGSPQQTGTMTMPSVRHILCQARDAGSIEWIYFEGGEPFLCYPLLLDSVHQAKAMGFRVGVVTNGQWGKDEACALETLLPLVGAVDDLSISLDRYHGAVASHRSSHVLSAANRLNIPTLTLSLDSDDGGKPHVGSLSDVMHRGRAADRLAAKRSVVAWSSLSECPHEDLANPSRVHVDAFGNVNVCQGIRIGNLFRTCLTGICSRYRPENCPVLGPLVEGGPAELVRTHGVPHEKVYADACHLCYNSRQHLRERFPQVLGPDQMYGVGLATSNTAGGRPGRPKYPGSGVSRSSHNDMVRRPRASTPSGRQAADNRRPA